MLSTKYLVKTWILNFQRRQGIVTTSSQQLWAPGYHGQPGQEMPDQLTAPLTAHQVTKCDLDSEKEVAKWEVTQSNWHHWVTVHFLLPWRFEMCTDHEEKKWLGYNTTMQCQFCHAIFCVAISLNEWLTLCNIHKFLTFSISYRSHKFNSPFHDITIRMVSTSLLPSNVRIVEV